MKKNILLNIVLVGVLASELSASNFKSLNGEVQEDINFKSGKVIKDFRWLNRIKDNKKIKVNIVLASSEYDKLSMIPHAMRVSTNKPNPNGVSYIKKLSIDNLKEDQINSKIKPLKKFEENRSKKLKIINSNEKIKIKKLLGDVKLKGKSRLLTANLTKAQIIKLADSGLAILISPVVNKRSNATTVDWMTLTEEYIVKNLQTKWFNGYKSFNSEGYGGQGLTLGINEIPMDDYEGAWDKTVIPSHLDYAEDSHANVGYTNGIGGYGYTTPPILSEHATHVSQVARIASPEAFMYFLKEDYTDSGMSDINIINRSFSQPTTVSGDSPVYVSDVIYDSESAQYDYASNSDRSLSILSAGNDCNDPDVAGGCYISHGKLAKNAITVGAMNRGSNEMADFSSYYTYNRDVQKPEIVEQGYANLRSSTTDFEFVAGTSFSAPFVSGFLNSIMSKDPSLTNYPAFMRALLLSQTDDNSINGVLGEEGEWVGQDGARKLRRSPYFSGGSTATHDNNWLIDNQWKEIGQVYLYSGWNVKAAISWMHTPYKFMRLEMKVVDPYGEIKAETNSVVGNRIPTEPSESTFRIKEFTTDNQGYHKIYVKRTGNYSNTAKVEVGYAISYDYY